MARPPARIQLTAEEESTLREWTRKGTGEQRVADRARIVLLSHEGMTVEMIAEHLHTRPARISKWRQRFVEGRLSALSDAPRPGKPHTYTEETERRVLRLLDQAPPDGYAQWNGPLLAQALGDVSTDHVWRILRKHQIQLQRRRSWCISTDPEFGPKAADVVGLYLNPPENALLLSVDEKPHIQALQRAQGYLRLPDGKALNGFSHCYKRHGTTTLFAALDIATGEVKTGHYARRRRREFLDFMNEIVTDSPDRQLHVVLDNLNTHKPKQDRWLTSHPNVHLHFHSALQFVAESGGMLVQHAKPFGAAGASFTSARQLRDAIDRFLKVHNEQAGRFE